MDDLEIGLDNISRHNNRVNSLQMARESFNRLLLAIINLYEVWILENSKRWLNRRWFRRPFFEEKKEKGFFHTTFQDLKQDEELLFKYLRMNLESFNYLLHLTEPSLRAKRKRKDGISPEERLAITIRYLASGDEIYSLSINHRIGESTTREIIQKTCEAIYKALSPVYLHPPCSVVFRNIAKGFYNEWNMPNCIGAIDGKHIGIVAPPNAGSLYFNYKKFHSIVLLAVCNQKYQFTLVDVGGFGGESDGGVFRRSNLGIKLDQGTLGIPPETPNLPNSDTKTPYFFVGDGAFGTSMHLMRPYPGHSLPEDQRIYNYRLSRARRCIENAFGILSARWRVLNNRIGFDPEIVKIMTMACICLHNYLLSINNSDQYCPENFIDQENENGEMVLGQWRNEVSNITCLSGTESNVRIGEADDVRDSLKDYFMTPEGEVSWQKDYINQGNYADAD